MGSRADGERRKACEVARFTSEDRAYGASRLPKTTVLQSTCTLTANVFNSVNVNLKMYLQYKLL